MSLEMEGEEGEGEGREGRERGRRKGERKTKKICPSPRFFHYFEKQTLFNHSMSASS